jgi:pyruvate ferredoxin oxidoreductase gamma subunit/2-oxoisovalerate ferredoxin oxidoreductase gamma subunit
MIEIRIHGRGGQGAVLASQILSYAYFLEGYYSQSFPSFGAERRGAPVNAFVRVSDSFIHNRYEITSPDYVIILSYKLAEIVDVTAGLKKDGIIFINSNSNNINAELFGGFKTVVFDITAIALENKLGSIYMPIVNVPILGVFSKYTGKPSLDSLVKAVPKFIPVNVDKNISALKSAYDESGLLKV